MGMKGFKGFEKDFSCKGKQYEENTTYEEHGVGCCHEGVMHFCEDPPRRSARPVTTRRSTAPEKTL